MAEATVREYSTVRCILVEHTIILRHTDKPPYFSAPEIIWRFAFGVIKGREPRHAIRSWRVKERSA